MTKVIVNNVDFIPFFALRPESTENIPILLQEADLDFSNQNDLRNPKMGSKQSIVGATQYNFFQKIIFGTNNHTFGSFKCFF